MTLTCITPGGSSVAQDADRSAGMPDVLATLKPGHPRLMAESNTWRSLQSKAQTDDQLAAVLTSIESEARALLAQAPITYHKTGRRLLAVSREALKRITFFAFSYRLTEDAKYLKGAEREMLAAAAFADWNPSHFLDTAEMTTALALGYDWLYDVLPETTRATVRTALVEKGLRIGAGTPFRSWKQNENNWNQVCFGGLTLGALALSDVEPALAREILSQAKTGIVNGLKPYAPDGVYPEGPHYWSYGTTFQVLMLAALESALGTSWDLEKSPGFLASARARVQLTGPSGLNFNFSDGHERGGLEPALFWFARRLNDSSLLLFQKEHLPSPRAASTGSAKASPSAFLPFAAIWWPDHQRESTNLPPLTWMGKGPNPVVVFRGAWNDPGAFYLAAKGGSANLSHGHMDAGSFVLEADGVRWACDLGLQEYESLESKGVVLWKVSQDSQRWQVFRLNNRSHNTLTIDDQLHKFDGAARILDFSSAGPAPFARIDLSPVLAGEAESATRFFRVLLPQRAALIEDSLSGLKPGADVRWAMVTHAEVTPTGERATLRQNGRSLQLRCLAPSAARFEVIPADPPADNFNAANPDTRILVLHAAAPASGRLRIAVVLQAGEGGLDTIPKELTSP